ncbi:leukotoxin LktA family filamentous adhesin [Roseovarius sp. SCSIO 43702]|uniref:leukotoxin LktA family filamentous adhesin n=1 Tax=Roseovarius sp. SCSIO 43702 TaxID=2823043 RepID=UPI001C738AA1|nr:leukotoxin LktA family filamentous adhesin [Roseovarius sp. SCSIO 43702]QYX57144.1 leukotoxin LktA family filamentous adhesin [Roseovarius sp. SCSIO 43702]
MTFKSLTAWGRNCVAALSSFAIAVTQVAPAWAQAAPSGITVAQSGGAPITATTITPGASGTFDITTGTIVGGIARNAFDQFNVGAAETVNLIQPGGSRALVNTVTGGTSTIAGQLNMLKNGQAAGSNVFLVNPDGVIVGKGGAITAGALTMSTATAGETSAIAAGDSAAIQRLFDRQEALSGAGIEVYGRIDAERLDLRAGGRMLLQGRISVEGGEGAAPAIGGAVNTEGMKQANGVSVENGVIRLFAGGDMTIGGGADTANSVTAKAGTSGGAVQAASGGSMTVKGDASIDVAGSTGDGGMLLLYTQGSAVLEDGLSLKASSVAGDGGIAALTAEGAAELGAIAADLGSDGGTGGALRVEAASLTVAGAGSLVTRGGDLALVGESIAVTNMDIDTRRRTGAGAVLSDAGDVILVAPEISMTNASVKAEGGAEAGGMIALLARDVAAEQGPLQTDTGAKAAITLADSALQAGAIVVNAVALASTVDDKDSAGSDTASESILNNMDGVLTDTADLVQKVATGALDAISSVAMLQLAELSADASVTITDSVLTADGDWKGLSRGPDATWNAGVLADNGILSRDGAAEETWTLLESAPEGLRLTGALPLAVSADSGGVIVQSDARTNVDIEPDDFNAGATAARSDASSVIRITDSALTAKGDTDVSVVSTAFDRTRIKMGTKDTLAGALGVVLSHRNVTNQTIIDGGSISGRDLRVAALTGKHHEIDNRSNAGIDGAFSAAITVNLGHSLTEAALGGTITASGKVDLDAETLFFGRTVKTNATIGKADDPKERQINERRKERIKGFAGKILGTAERGKSEAGGEDSTNGGKVGFGMALTMDLSLERQDTYATLGGRWHDGGTLVQLAATNVAATEVDVDAVTRFARPGNGSGAVTGFRGEGGGTLARSTLGGVGTLGAVQAKIQQQRGLTKEEIVSQYGHAMVITGSFSNFGGHTEAEIGAATVTAARASVDARTALPLPGKPEQIRAAIETFADAVTDFRKYDPASLELPETPQLPELDGFFSLDEGLVTSRVETSAIGTSDTDKPQSSAIGVTAAYDGYDFETRARIGTGAVLTLSETASVNAVATGVITGYANKPGGSSLKPGGATAAVGGTLSAVRLRSITEADIAAGARIVAGGTPGAPDAADVAVTARNGMVLVTGGWAGGAAAKASVNGMAILGAFDVATRARIGAGADIVADAVTVDAKDESVLVGVAGALSVSENVGVGVGMQMFVGTRDTRASLDGATVTATRLAVNAETAGVMVSAAAAGAVVRQSTPKSGGGSAPSTPAPGGGGDDEDVLIPSWFFDEDENAAISDRSQFDTAEEPQNVDADTGQATGGKGSAKAKTGFSIAGAAALNILLENATVAEIGAGSTVELTGALDVTAKNRTIHATVAGAPSLGIGSKNSNNALAGALAGLVDGTPLAGRDTMARITGAVVTAGDTTVEAEDLSIAATVAIGGAGSTRGTVVMAGSVAGLWAWGSTRAVVEDSAVSVAALDLDAKDASINVTLGGAAGANLSKEGALGAGLGVAIKLFNRSAEARLSTDVAGRMTEAEAITVDAQRLGVLIGVATSVGVGKTGLSGSAVLNTRIGDTRAIIGGGTERLGLKADSVRVKANEDSHLWSLAGAIGGGIAAAVGGAATANVIVTDTDADLRGVDLAARDGGDLGEVVLLSDAKTTIGTLAVAGQAAKGKGVGMGVTLNNITAQVRARADGSTVSQAARFDAQARNTRNIWSGAGGVAGAGGGAAGMALAVNLLTVNQTLVDLDNAAISTRTGGIRAEAVANGQVVSVSAALGISGAKGAAGAVTLNSSLGETKVTADRASLDSAGDMSLLATDHARFSSVAGGVTGSGAGSAGAGISGNLMLNRTEVVVTDATLRLRGGALRARAESKPVIDAVAVGFAGSGGAGLGGSIIVADIGNITSARITGTDIDAGTSSVTVEAESADPSVIRLDPSMNVGFDGDGRALGNITALAGGASIAGASGVGIAATIVLMHNTVEARLEADDLVAGNVTVTATNDIGLNAAAVSGAGSGASGVAGSLVFTQIGVAGASEEDLIDEVAAQADADRPENARGDDISDASAQGRGDNVTLAEGVNPVEEGRELAVKGRDAAFDALERATDLDLDFVADAADSTQAVVKLGKSADIGNLTIRSDEKSVIRSAAGAAGIGSTNGVGLGITVNGIWGQSLAHLELADGVTLTAGDLEVKALQSGGIATFAGTGGVGAGSAGGAGSLVINSFGRRVASRIKGGVGVGIRAGDITVASNQSGNILGGALALAGASAGAGGASVMLNLMADEVDAEVKDVAIGEMGGTVDTPVYDTDKAAGAVRISARRELISAGTAASGAASGTGALAGGLAFNTDLSSVQSRLWGGSVVAESLDVAALNDIKLISVALGGAADGSFSAGLSVAANTAGADVLADIAGTRARTRHHLTVTADAITDASGNAVGGAASGVAAVAGTLTTNVLGNRVRAIVHGPAAVGPADLATAGTALIRADAINNISLAAGADEMPDYWDDFDIVDLLQSGLPTLNVSFAGAGWFSAGGTLAANITGNDVTASVRNRSSITALGHHTLTDPGDPEGKRQLRGAVIEAQANTVQSGANVTGGFSTAVALNGLVQANVIGDRAVVELGTGGQPSDAVRVNRAAEADLLAELGLVGAGADAHAEQDTVLRAQVRNDVLAFGGTVNFGLYAGLSGTAAGTVIGSKARVLTNLSDLGARRDIALESRIETQLVNVAVAAGTGAVGLGGALGVHVVGSDALTEVRGGVLTAREGDVEIDAAVSTKALTMAGTLGAGAAGVGMSLQATVFGSKAIARVAGADGGGTTPTIVTSQAGDVAVRADTNAYTLSGVAGVSGGVAAISLSANAAVMKAETRVDVGAGVTLDAGRDVKLAATEFVRLRGLAGSAAGGPASTGGSFNYTRFAGTTQVNVSLSANAAVMKAETRVDVGAGVTLDAGRDVKLAATEFVRLRGLAGSAAGGPASTGGSFNYTRFAGTTQVNVGERAVILAGRDVIASAKADRIVMGGTVVGAVSTGAISAAAVSLNVVDMGGTAASSDAGQALPQGPDGAAPANTTSQGDAVLGLRDDYLDDAQARLNRGAQAPGSATLAERGGAGAAVTRNDEERAKIDLTSAPEPDKLAVTIAADAMLAAGRDLTLSADTVARAELYSGNVTFAPMSFGGVAAGFGVGVTRTGALVSVGERAVLRADRNVTLQARTRGQKVGGEDGPMFDAVGVNASTGGISAAVGGVVVVDSSDSAVDIAAGAMIEGRSGGNAQSVTIEAERAGGMLIRSLNASGSGFISQGASFVLGLNSGTSRVNLAGAAGQQVGVKAARVTLDAADRSEVRIQGLAAALGAVANSINVAVGRNAGRTELTLTEARLRGGTITLANETTAVVTTQMLGVSVGVAGVGGSLSVSLNDATQRTRLSGVDIEATDVSVDTVASASATAESAAGAGAMLAANGSVSIAVLGYDAETSVSGRIAADNKLSIRTASVDAKADADARAFRGGILAGGATIAVAQQSTARVVTDLRSGNLTAREIRLQAINGSNMTADTISGSGGVVAGQAALTWLKADSETRLKLASGGVLDIDARTLGAGSSSQTVMNGHANSVNASVVGASGALLFTSSNSELETSVGAGARITADVIELSAVTGIKRPRHGSGWNVKAGSGGVVAGAAMKSDVEVHADTKLTVANGAVIRQTGSYDDPGAFRLIAGGNMDLTDRQKLDVGGLVATPGGVSSVVVHKNDATVSIGNATLSALGDLEILNGSNVDIRSEVDAKSYGLAGAGFAKTTASYNGSNRINIGGGAVLEAERDIVLGAGRTAAGSQRINIRAESRVFNNTAFAITVPTTADARAATTSRVTIDENAELRAVRDVELSAISGGRDVVGYGRAKDLSRAAIEAVGNFFGDLVGADEISLDIESGTSTDTHDDGIIVNGNVRAGTRNQVVLRFATLGGKTVLVDPDDPTKPADLTDPRWRDISYALSDDYRSSGDLQQRIDYLDGLINNPALSTGESDAAKVAWRTEKALLEARRDAQSGSFGMIELGPVRASSGNIVMDADWVQGGPTGKLTAPGNVLIDILSTTSDVLKTGALTIPPGRGGEITLRSVSVTSGDDLRALSGGRGGDYSLALETSATGDAPLINVATQPANGIGGTIVIGGDADNFSGEILVNSAYGDIDVRGAVAAQTVKIEAPNGDFILGYVPGIRSVSGDPDAQYDGRFKSYEDAYRDYVRAFGTIARRDPGASLVVNNGGFRAGKNVYITADTLNINGDIIAGKASYTVDISASAQSTIDAIAARGGVGSELVHAASGNGPTLTGVSSDADIFFNHGTGRLEVADMSGQGGRIEIVGKIISTGGGRIESLSGWGAIDVRSAVRQDLVLGKIDLGAKRLDGVIRITDTSRALLDSTTGAQLKDRDGIGRFLTTEFRREGDQLKTYTNRSQTAVYDPESRVTRELATVEEGSVTGRTTSFAPKANQDYIVRRAEDVTHVVTTRRSVETIVFNVFKTKDKTRTTQIATSTRSVDLGQGPFVGASLGGADYNYAFSGQRVSQTGPSTVETNYEDNRWGISPFGVDLKVGWRHWTYDTTTKTRHLYEHRLKADHAIDIGFGGNDAARLNVVANGSVIFGGSVRNIAGETSAQSIDGSVLTGGRGVVLNTAALSLRAEKGRIGSLDGAFRLVQANDAAVSAVAKDGIALREMNGALRVAQAEATGSGASVSLMARGDLLKSGAGIVKAHNVDLTSEAGAIGGAGAPFAIDTGAEGRLIAQARGDIAIAELTGDLGVGTVRSSIGSVALSAPGAILDRNDDALRDLRTAEELRKLWTDELGLNGAGLADREQEQTVALQIDIRAEYDAYWRARGATAERREIAGADPDGAYWDRWEMTGGDAQTYTLDADRRAAIEAAGGDVDAYVAKRRALYAEWNAQNAYDNGYTYQPVAADLAPRRTGMEWTQAQLERSIRAGLVRETADTRTRIEAANVMAAGDITLSAGAGLGALLEPYVIDPGAGTLTGRDLEVLSGAVREDITRDAEGRYIVRQAEDFNFGFSDIDPATGAAKGRLTVTVGGQEAIFAGAETAANLGLVNGRGDVRLKIDGAMTDAGLGDVAITGRLLVLEAGDAGTIGTEDAPLRVGMLEGGALDARAGGDVNIAAPALDAAALARLGLGGQVNGDIGLSEVFSRGTVRITADGALFDAAPTGAPRIVARAAALNAASIGTASAPLGIKLDPLGGGGLRLRTAQNAHVAGSGDLRLDSARIGGSGALGSSGLLTLWGNDTLSFGDNLALTATGGIDSTNATGTDISGGALTLTLGGTAGAGKPLATAIDQLTLTAIGTAGLDLSERDDLAVTTATLGSGALTLAAGGHLTAGTITSLGTVTLASLEDIVSGDVTAQRVTATASGAIGRASALRLTAPELSLRAGGTVDARILRAATLTRFEAGQGNSTLDASGHDLMAQAGSAFVSEGNLLVEADDLTLNTSAHVAEGFAISAANVVWQDITAGTLDLDALTLRQTGGKTADIEGRATLTLTGAATFEEGARLEARVATLDTGNLGLGATSALETTEDLTINVAGTLVQGAGATVEGSVIDATAGGAVSIGDGSRWAARTGALGLTAGGSLTRGDRTALTAGQGLTLTAASMTAGTESRTTAGGALEVETLSGGMDWGADGTLSGAMILAKSDADISLGARNTWTSAGMLDLQAGGDVTVGAAAHLVAGDSLGFGVSGSLSLGAGASFAGAGIHGDVRGAISLGDDASWTARTNDVNVHSAGLLMRGDKTSISAGDDIRLWAAAMVTGNRSRTVAQDNVWLVADRAEMSWGADAEVSGATIGAFARGDMFLGDRATWTATRGEFHLDAGGHLTRGDKTALSAAQRMVLAGATMVTGRESQTIAGGAMTLDAMTGGLSWGADGTLSGQSVTATAAGDVDLGARTVWTSASTLDLTATGEVSLGEAAVLTAGTSLTLAAGGSLAQGAGSVIRAAGPDVDVSAGGDFTQAAGALLDGGAARVSIGVKGDMVLRLVQTSNATDAALNLTVSGTLSRQAEGQAGLVADADGALTVLRAGAVAPTGPVGLEVALARLDAIVAAGSLHLAEASGLILERAETAGAVLDIAAAGDMTVRRAKAAGDIVLTSGGDLISDLAQLDAREVRLFAFGGALRGETTGTFRADLAPGATAYLLANGDLDFAETQGDLRMGFALSDTGDVTLAAETGSMEVGVLGVGDTLTMVAAGDLVVNALGGVSVDLADETRLKLIGPERYGVRDAGAARVAQLTAMAPGANLRAGLLNVRERLTLEADRIDAFGYDPTAADGIDLTIHDAQGDMAEEVMVRMIGDGPDLFLADPFTPIRSLLGTRATGGTTGGETRIARGRIQDGRVIASGPRLSLSDDVAVGNVAWFEQRTSKVLVTRDYAALSTIADAQILAGDMGFVAFDLENLLELRVRNGLVLNRKTGGLAVNGGQGFGFDIGVETDLLGRDFVRGLAPAGVVRPAAPRWITPLDAPGTTWVPMRGVSLDESDRAL